MTATMMTVDQFRASHAKAIPGGPVANWIWDQMKKAIGDNVLQTDVALNAEHATIDWLGTFVLGTNTTIDDAAYNELIVAHESEFDALVREAIDFARARIGLEPLHPIKTLGTPTDAVNNQRTRFHGIVRILAVSQTMKANPGKYKSRRECLDAINAKITDSDWDQAVTNEGAKTGVTPQAIGDGTILQWLFSHKDEILAFVLQILKLFGFVI